MFGSLFFIIGEATPLSFVEAFFETRQVVSTISLLVYKSSQRPYAHIIGADAS